MPLKPHLHVGAPRALLSFVEYVRDWTDGGPMTEERLEELRQSANMAVRALGGEGALANALDPGVAVMLAAGDIKGAMQAMRDLELDERNRHAATAYQLGIAVGALCTFSSASDPAVRDLAETTLRLIQEGRPG